MSTGDVKQLFGAAVRNQRNQLQMSQEELADRSGLHRTYISDIERGARNVSLQSIEKLASALDLSVSNLFSKAANGVRLPPLIEILLIEDNRQDVELTARAFRKARITNVLNVVEDGEAALDFLFATGKFANQKNHTLPGLILLDLNLPKVNGLEVLSRIKADPRTQHIPVIVLTVSSQDKTITDCQMLGAASYIVKPVGFRNFSEVTPHLDFDWALMKPK